MSKSKKKNFEDYEKVVCLTCGLDGDLYFDMTYTNNGDSEDGVDIDEVRDPVRCIICRQNTRHPDNELLECEDCEEHYGPFYWSGKHNDCIICIICLKNDLGLPIDEHDYADSNSDNENDSDEESDSEEDSEEGEYTTESE